MYMAIEDNFQDNRFSFIEANFQTTEENLLKYFFEVVVVFFQCVSANKYIVAYVFSFWVVTYDYFFLFLKTFVGAGYTIN